jgi:macrolide transport system ATP-binding/permease protein
VNELIEARRLAAGASHAAPLIALSGITKTYGGTETPVQVLHGIDLEIFPGEFLAILGASGSGKSTMMNLLGCLDRPTTGQYWFDGQDVAGLDPDALAALRRETFGFVFQSYHLIPTATALENVAMPAIYAGLGTARRTARADALLSELGMADRLHHRPSQLSGGQQQRVAIGRALMNGGRVILADEPTGALDTATGQEVMAQLAALNRAGHTVILITHDRDVARHARRIVEMRDGRIVADSGAAPAAPSPLADVPHAAPGPHPFTGLGSALLLALRSLAAHRLRTALTLLGMVIGVASVVAMMAVGEGTRLQVVERFNYMGVNNLMVRPGGPNIRWAPSTLTISDAEALGRLPNIAGSLPEMVTTVTVRTQLADMQTGMNGTTDAMLKVRNWRMEKGVFISAEDVAQGAAVAVLGDTVLNSMFLPGEDPIGQFVLVNNIPFRVIGVLARKGAAPQGWDQDDVIFVPVTAAALRVTGQRFVRSIMLLVEDAAKLEDSMRDIRTTLLARHRVEDFSTRSMTEAIEAAAATADNFTVMLGAVAAISLLVGGIGVMNIMLVGVAERRREIGIRMAVGARRGDIAAQFLTEAALVASLGGLAGAALGLGVAAVLPLFGTATGIQAGPVVLALGTAVATGLVFGFAPARKAAALDPVAALAAD